LPGIGRHKEAMTIRLMIPLLIMLIVSITVYHWLDGLLYPRPRRRASSDGGGADFGSNSDGGGGWSFGHWFGSSDSSGNPTDASGGDGGGSDGGGGDGGGGD
jgi:hypothetical protein